MTRQYEMIIVAPLSANIEAIKQTLIYEISQLDNVTLETTKQSESFGMNKKDIVLSFVISVVAGFSVNMFQADVENALSKAGQEIKEQITVIDLSSKKVVKEDVPSKDTKN